MAQHGDEGPPRQIRPEQMRRDRVRPDHLLVAVDQQDRIGQRIDKRDGQGTGHDTSANGQSRRTLAQNRRQVNIAGPEQSGQGSAAETGSGET